jgi:hypothetical protein
MPCPECSKVAASFATQTCADCSGKVCGSCKECTSCGKINPSPLNNEGSDESSSSSSSTIPSSASSVTTVLTTSTATENAKKRKHKDPEENSDSTAKGGEEEESSKDEIIAAIKTEHEEESAGSSTAVAASCAKRRRAEERLDAPSSVSYYVAEMKKHEDTWSGKTPEEKIAIFRAVINEKFALLGIPPLTIELLDPSSGRNGECDSTSWSFRMSPATLAKPLSESAATAYHESRHAEQFYMIAKGITKGTYTEPLHNQIPARVLAAARDNPDLSDEDATKAASFHRSVFGTDAAERRFVLIRLGTYTASAYSGKIKACGAARKEAFDLTEEGKKYKLENQEEYERTSGKKWADAGNEKRELNIKRINDAKAKAAIAEEDMNDTKNKMDLAQAQYKALPEEADAFKCGDMVAAEFAKAPSHSSVSESSASAAVAETS